MSHPQGGGAFGQPRHEGIVDAVADDQPAAGGAALPGGIERSIERALHRLLQVGIIRHHQRILAAHFQLHLDATHCARLGQALACALGAGKAQRIDAGVQHGWPQNMATAHHQVEHASRQTGTLQDVGQRPGRPGNQFGRLQYHGVAEGQRGGCFPCGDRDREVPGGDQPHHPHRLAADENLNSGTHRVHQFPLHTQGLPGKEFENLSGTRHFTYGFGQGLAFLSGQEGAQHLPACQDLAPCSIQNVRALLRRCA